MNQATLDRPSASARAAPPFTILVVDDNPGDTELILQALEEADLKAVGGELQIEVRATAEGALKALEAQPVDLILTADEQWLLTVNQTSNSVSLVRTATGEVASEVAVGERPSALALTPDEKHVLVSGTFCGDLTVLALDNGNLTKVRSLHLGFEPRGVAVAPDGALAYVALTSAHQVAVIDWQQGTVLERIPVGRWPRRMSRVKSTGMVTTNCTSPMRSRRSASASLTGGPSISK